MSLLERFREETLASMSDSEYGICRPGNFLELTSLIQSLSGLALKSGDLTAMGSAVKGVDDGGIRSSTSNRIQAGAMDQRPKNAVFRAYGELLERLATAFHDPREVIRSRSYQDIVREHYTPPPEDWALCEDWQYAQPGFPLSPYTRDAVTDWIPVEHPFRKDKPTVIPFTFVHKVPDGTGRFHLPTSNGCAFHWSYDKACASALLELIERDTLLIHWRTWRKGKIITVDQIRSAELADLWDEASGIREDLRLILLENEFNVPVVMAALLGDSPYAGVVSTAASLDLEQGIRKCILEMAQVCSMIRAQSPDTLSKWRKRVANMSEDDSILTFIDHIYYYMDPANLARLSFLYQDAEKLLLSEWESRQPHWLKSDEAAILPALLNQFRDLDYEVMFKSYRTPELRTLGGFAVRAICPAMIPLDYQHRARALRSPRYGMPGRDLNPFPHPLA